MKKTLTFTLLAVVACLAMVSPARGQQTDDIVDTAVAAGSFTTRAKLPAGTLGNLLKPENKTMLVRVLTSHVVPGDGGGRVVHVIDHVLLPPGE